MATYKVIQDVEADDKLLGPLSLRQFIYGCIAALCGYFCFVGVAKHFYPLFIIFLPIMALFGFFAFPWGRDQPTEVWALAKVRFMLLPRRRLWDQSGMKELVTVTAPKKTNDNYTNNLSQTEVKSRLKALADTIDSRGWVVKNVDPSSAASIQAAAQQSDRLVNMASMPQEVSNVSMPTDDMLDENSQTAVTFDQMINSSEAKHREQLMQAAAGKAPANPAPPQTQAPATNNQPAATPAPDNFWFLNQAAPGGQQPYDASVIAPGTTDDDTSTAPDDAALAEQLKANKKTPDAYSAHMRNIKPLSEQPKPQPHQQPVATTPPPQQQAQSAQPEPVNPAKTNDNSPTDDKIERDRLASNNDLSVAAIARQVDKKQDDGEVVISLH